jgi:PRC-barrel domain protein
MRNHYFAAAAMTLIALCATVCSAAKDNPAAHPQNEPSPESPAKTPGAPLRELTVTVLDNNEVQSTLGKQVRGGADENMGRMVDVIVDRTGQVRAAIIDFGGFLGVGSRKIAVAWNALHFSLSANKVKYIALELTRDEVRTTPEYNEDKPVVVLGASGSLDLLPSR